MPSRIFSLLLSAALLCGCAGVKTQIDPTSGAKTYFAKVGATPVVLHEIELGFAKKKQQHKFTLKVTTWYTMRKRTSKAPVAGKSLKLQLALNKTRRLVLACSRVKRERGRIEELELFDCPLSRPQVTKMEQPLHRLTFHASNARGWRLSGYATKGELGYIRSILMKKPD